MNDQDGQQRFASGAWRFWCWIIIWLEMAWFLLGKHSTSVQMNQLVKTLSNTELWEGAFDHNVTAGSEPTQQHFGRWCWERWKDLRDIGRTLIDKFPWFSLKHEAKKLLVRFRFEDDGFAVEATVQKDFIRREIVYTQAPLHKEAFTQKSCYMESAYTQRLYTQELLHTRALTHRRLYTENLLHTQSRFLPQALVQTDAFTYRRLYTEQLLHRRFYTQKPVLRESVHSEAFPESSFSKEV